MKINHIDFNEEKIDLLVQDIKKKKELNSLSDDFVKEQLIDLLKKNHKLSRQLLENFTHKSKQYREITKLVRGDLRRVYGLFRGDKVNERNKLVKEFCKKPNDKKLLERLLQHHSSTKERLPHYKKLYAQIFAITKKPKIILDLGCGINPFSLHFMDLKDPTYYAYDLSKTEIDNINKFFKYNNTKGKASIMDITKLEKLPKADVAFLFKMTDAIDRNKGHKGTEEVLKHIPAKFIILSFATLTISGKPMRAPRRRWMEWLCNRLDLKFDLVEIPNELFYVIEK